MTAQFSTIKVSVQNNSIPKRDYWTAGALVFNPRANMIGFTYDPEYCGPPIDPVNMNYKQTGIRTFLFSADKPLPKIIRRFLPTDTQRKALKQDMSYLDINDDYKMLQYLGHNERNGFLLSANQLVFTDGKHECYALDNVDLTSKLGRDLRLFADSLDRTRMPDENEIYKVRPTYGDKRINIALLSGEGDEWLAKIPSADAGYNSARIEHLTLSVLNKAGFDVPRSRLHEDKEGNLLLLVERFDVKNKVRQHTITLDDLFEVGASSSYNHFSRVLRLSSSNFNQDKDRLAQSIVIDSIFNVTDNHGANFSLISNKEGYLLSPLYDKIPNPAKDIFSTRLGTSRLNFMDTQAINQLHTATGVPVSLLSHYAQSLYRAIQRYLPQLALEQHIPENEWSAITSAIEVNQPQLAKKLPKKLTQVTFDNTCPSLSDVPSP